MDAITYWNDVVQEADRVAHTTLHVSESGARGPAGSSRAFAIVHLAMHDAYFTIHSAPHGTYLTSPATAPGGAQADAAIAAAAHATLSKLYPNQKPFFDQAHLSAGLSGPGLATGHAHGLAVAQAILAARAGDPGTGDDGYAASTARGHHRPDPSHPGQGYHAPFYGARAKCFAVTTRHLLDAAPSIGSGAYQDALEEVRGRGIAPELMGNVAAQVGGPNDRRDADRAVLGL